MSENMNARDYAPTLALPKTTMPMKANQPELEKRLLEKWESEGLYQKLRNQSAALPKFVLHDGPPYANGNIHLGHALNKVLKDAMVRSFQMRGFNAAFVPGWDCHGLPIEWKVEEKYRNAGKTKDDVSTKEFRQECRDFASHWVGVQSEEFKKLGVLGDFDNPYLTMAFEAEATIAKELMNLAETGQVYRGSKPVMWSVVEQTALAEAEVEHHDFESDTVWVKFPLNSAEGDLSGSFVVIWTTTPWTLPANKAVAFSKVVSYGLYEVSTVTNDYGPKVGERYLLADALATSVAEKGKVTFARVRPVSAFELENLVCDHPLKALGYKDPVPMLEGDHVTDAVGTGFVHTAPGHGLEDFELWTRNVVLLDKMGFNTKVPFVVDDAGFLTEQAPGFGPSSEHGAARVFDQNGKKGDANKRVVSALIEANALVAMSRLKHSYPHSWRSGKPVFYRNTPQWFVSMDRKLDDGLTLRERALKAVSETEFVPASGGNKLRNMVETRPDWVLSRQRKWGVPITLFYNVDGDVLVDKLANTKIAEAFHDEGADAWFAVDAKDRFLGHRTDVDDWQMVTDILDVWFDSGCTHAFTTEARPELETPAAVYLEGSDQHRGWFQSSLLESCATRGRAPFKSVVTHGFVLGEDNLKMAKSKSNGVSPQAVMEKHGADVLRLWALSSDYQSDVRMGPNALQTAQDAFRKLRNTLRWMSGMLSHDHGDNMQTGDLPELEQLMLHKLSMLSEIVKTAYDQYDFKRVAKAVGDFMNVELSAFYFEVRKDALYCDPRASTRRRASFYVLRQLFSCLTAWLAPLVPFVTEEAWLETYPNSGSVHLRQFPETPNAWRNDVLAEKWETVADVRRVANVCLELARKQGLMGKSAEACPVFYVEDDHLHELLLSIPMETVLGTSGVSYLRKAPPNTAYSENSVSGLAVEFMPAKGVQCARSRSYTEDVGADPRYPDVSFRDAIALAELDEAS